MLTQIRSFSEKPEPGANRTSTERARTNGWRGVPSNFSSSVVVVDDDDDDDDDGFAVVLFFFFFENVVTTQPRPSASLYQIRPLDSSNGSSTYETTSFGRRKWWLLSSC